MDDKKIVIIPDVHGRTFWRTVLDNTENKIIFLGDYTDPYEYEGITDEDALREFEDIIRFKKRNMDRVILLLGNHDLGYIYPIFATCRHSNKYFMRFHNMFMQNFSLFQIAHQEGDILFTHAGVTKDWAKKNEIKETHIIRDLTHLFQYNPIKYFTVGQIRGGLDKSGSPIWADINEHAVLEPFSFNLTQIFGHSQQDKNPVILEDDLMICLDCRKVFVLENNELKEYGI